MPDLCESGTAVINIIDKFRVNTGSHAFRCIMIYRDLDSDFCFIRPLLDKIELEIVMELFKIFTSYGAPRMLQLTSGAPASAANMEAHLRALCPAFGVCLVKHNTQDYLSAMKVVTKLREWMTWTELPEWEVGCSIVQRQLNQEPTGDSALTPHQRFFRGVRTSTATPQNTNQPKTYSRQAPRRNDAQKSISQEPSAAPTNEVNPNITQDRMEIHFDEFQPPQKPKPTKSTKSLLRIPELNSKSLLRQSIDAIRVKEEMLEQEELETGSEGRGVFEGGATVAGIKTETQIEIKVEPMDE